MLAADVGLSDSLQSMIADAPSLEGQGYGFVSHDHHDELPETLTETMDFGGGVPTVYNAMDDSGGGPGGGSGGHGPNLKIIDAYLRDGLGNRITSPYLGQRVAIMVQYETHDLPAGASYTIHYSIDGVTLDNGTRTFGAGQSEGTWFWWRSGWFASAGSHNVVATVDGLNSVGEVDENDNSFSFSFTSTQAVDFPQPLIWPMEGDPYFQMPFTNYVDVNPTSGINDFYGGSFSYDGHNAWDIGPPNFHEQDLGVEIYAAADGTVIDAHDGEFDRRTSWETPQPQANYLRIDHGGGWTTIYWHLRRDSLRVEVGDVVQAGDVLGYMGSSGVSSGTHIHFGLQHHGFTVEPMYDVPTYLDASLASIGYVGDIEALVTAGTTNSNPASHIKERPSDVNVFKQRSSQLVYFWSWYSGLRTNDFLQHVWRRPNGSQYLTTSLYPAQNWSQSWYWWSRNLPATPDLGTWTIDVNVNGAKIGEHTFEVTVDGEPEIRVEQSGGLILDDRVTPIDFGTRSQGSSAASQSFTVFNHGEDTLNLGPINVPRGFVVTNGLPATLAPGQSDLLTIQMQTADAGYFGGQVRIDTDDTDEQEYEFSIEGVVTAAALPQQLILGLSERKLGEGKQLFGNVRRTDSGAGLGSALTVNLSSDDPDNVTVPANVTIPAGSDRVIFPITTTQDGVEAADKIVELHASSAATIDAWNELSIINVPLPPKVEGVILNGGDPQRSSVTDARVIFNQLVNIDASSGSPFHFSNIGSDAIVDFNSAVSIVGNQTVVDFQFASEVNAAGSLVDGDYRLVIEAASITAGGLSLDGNADSISGDDFTFGTSAADSFFRKYGDQNGSGTVELFDFAAFRSTFGKSSGDAGYLPELDSNADNTINLFDFAAFRANFGT